MEQTSIDDSPHVEKTNACRLNVWSHSMSSGKVGLRWIKAGISKDNWIKIK